MRLASLVLITAGLFFSAPALAQFCEGSAVATRATCGNDVCDCASPCTDGTQCSSGCCASGFCALACVCEGQGTVDTNCGVGGGCSTVAQQDGRAPGGGSPMALGFALVALGAIASARFVRRRGARSAGAVLSLSLAVLGSALVIAAASESRTPRPEKALRR